MARTLDQIRILVSLGDVQSFYSSGYWRKKREHILRRDDYSCQMCLGKFQNDEQSKIKRTKAKYVHHIIALKDNFDLALEDDNLVSLCFNCHEIVEKREKFKMINAKSKEKQTITEEKW